MGGRFFFGEGGFFLGWGSFGEEGRGWKSFFGEVEEFFGGIFFGGIFWGDFVFGGASFFLLRSDHVLCAHCSPLKGQNTTWFRSFVLVRSAEDMRLQERIGGMERVPIEQQA